MTTDIRECARATFQAQLDAGLVCPIPVSAHSALIGTVGAALQATRQGTRTTKTRARPAA